jgi:hypothetical protein
MDFLSFRHEVILSLARLLQARISARRLAAPA